MDYHNTAAQPTRKRRRTTRRLVLLGILLLIASPFLACAVLAIRFYSGKPNPSHDYYADLNALRDQYTEEERAWGLYLGMQLRVQTLQSEISESFDRIATEQGIEQDNVPAPFNARPGDAFFEEAARAVADSGLLDEVRQAAGRPIMGTLITDRYANDPPTTIEDFLPPNRQPAQQDFVLWALLPTLGDARNAAKLLAFDAHRSAHAGDAERTIENIRDIIRIANQCEREPFLISDLVAIAIAQLAAGTTIEILDRNPSLFDDAHLLAFSELFLSDALQAATIDFSHERMVQQDFLQRIYTDDGRGSGRITPDSFKAIEELADDTTQIVPAALFPILAVLIADRAELSAAFDEGIRLAELMVQSPADHYPSWAERERKLRHPAPIDTFRFTLLMILEPALAKTAQTQVQARTRLQATAARLALEHYKLTEGRYPDTLAELIPTYLPELPQDPFDPGHPLHYLLHDGVPYIYSVGSNGVDDGATPTPEGTNPANLEARFADPAGPSPNAPNADWILFPPTRLMPLFPGGTGVPSVQSGTPVPPLLPPLLPHPRLNPTGTLPMHRSTRRILIVTGASALAFGIYYALAARAYFSTPTPAANPIAAINAALRQAPEHEHAAPAYAALNQAWEAAKPERSDPLPYGWWQDLRPGHPDYEGVAVALRALEPQLAEARHAAARPVLGIRLFPVSPELQRERGGPELDPVMADSLINSHIPALTDTSTAINLLLLDATHAAADADPARFTADVHAALGAARQIRELPLSINDIIAIRAVAHVGRVVRQTLADHPDLLDAPALAALQKDLADTARHHAVLRVDSERTGIADLLDRSFSPGPRGRITAVGIRRLTPMIQYGDQNDRLFPAVPDPDATLAPLRSRRIASRAEQLKLYDSYIAAAQAAQTGGYAAIARFQGTEWQILRQDDPRATVRYSPVQAFTPAISGMLHTELTTRLEAEAAILALAVHRYRLDHARLPGALDQLIPDYADTLPADPSDPAGGPIKYLVHADLFTLYYNGANGIDDHATPHQPDPNDPHAARRFHTGQPNPNAPNTDWILFPPPADPAPVF